MRRLTIGFVLRQGIAAVAVAAVALVALPASQATDPAAVATREQAYRSNNLGVARLEQFDFEGAAAAFREALGINPQLAIARLNLGVALFYGGNTEAARTEIVAAQPNLPSLPHPDYLLALIDRTADRTDEAIAAFTRVTTMDAADAGAWINLGQLYWQERRDKEAIDAFRRALSIEPYNGTATYGLATALLRTGGADEGRELMTRFERLTDAGAAVTYSRAYLEQGRYAEAMASTGLEPELVSTAVPAIAFTNATAQLMPPAASTTGAVAAARATAATPDGAVSSVTLFDLDDDDDLDLAEAGVTGVGVWRNEGGRLVSIGASVLGTTATRAATGILAGDYGNDGHTDLVVLRGDGLALLRRDPDAGFTDVTAAAGLSAQPGPVRSAAWLDADHDGDLDLFVVAGPANAASSLTLWRNNGNQTFVNVTSETRLTSDRVVNAVIPTDFDNRRDVDLLLVTDGGAPYLFRNLRDNTFRDAAGDVGLTVEGRAAMAAIGDVNKDGYPDLFFADPNGPGQLATSDGRGRFMTSRLDAASAARGAQFVDYDSDGLLDLLLLTDAGPRVLRNAGRDWMDVSARAIPAAMNGALAEASSLATGDVNGDGRVDIVAGGRSGPSVWLNDAGTAARSLAVHLDARVSNRSAVGARVELRAGSLRQQHEVYAASPAPATAHLLFGLGDRSGVDVVRVLWPSGILQAETGPSANAMLPPGATRVEELNRKPSSCPYLFTWNGERFEFVTDFLGGGEMGAWLAPGVRNTPDPDEYVRIRGDQLHPRNGRYEIRITNELEEALFLDRAQLLVVAHPRDVEVYPNEGLGRPEAPFAIYTTRHARPPVSATDDDGSDVLERVSRIDRRYPEGFPLERVRGYAADHVLTLTLPPPHASGRRVLLLTGWTDYAFSSDNVAASQADIVALPPSLEVKDANGVWRTALDSIGMPVGRPQTVVVDLTDRVPATVRDVRIRTSLRIYWDQVLVDTSDGRAPVTLTRLEPADATLRWRGFSREVTPDGREPFGYNYDVVSRSSPWKLLPGRYTREGDVRELLTTTDDMFIVSRSGDETSLSFDATALTALPTGWTRTFLLFAEGFSKEMNLRSASPDAVSPLPFRGMTAYPYEAPEAYPSTPAHRAYIDRYNTRVVPRTLPPIELEAR